MGLALLCLVIAGQFSLNVAAPKPIVDGQTAGVISYDFKLEKFGFRSEYTFVALLKVWGRYNSTSGYKVRVCGGVIIRPDVILTVAHCLTWSYELPTVLVSAGITEIELEHGEGQNIFMKDTAIHENYTESEYENDIAIIWLEKPFDINEKVTTASKAPFDSDLINKTGFAVGWGAEGNSYLNMILQKGEMTIMSQKICKQFYYDIPFTDGMMCAHSENTNAVPCIGDAGGPFVVENYVVGLITLSFQHKVNEGKCMSYAPSAFVNLKHYVKWIDEQLKRKSV